MRDVNLIEVPMFYKAVIKFGGVNSKVPVIIVYNVVPIIRNNKLVRNDGWFNF